jgi:hypothetical protein
LTSLRQLRPVEGDLSRQSLESFIANRLYDAGVWPSPRASDGIASHREIERTPDLLRVCGEVWHIDQTRHTFWLDVTWEHGPQYRATWTLFFSIDTTGMTPRRARQAIEVIQEPEQVSWRATLTGNED